VYIWGLFSDFGFSVLMRRCTELGIFLCLSLSLSLYLARSLSLARSLARARSLSLSLSLSLYISIELLERKNERKNKTHKARKNERKNATKKERRNLGKKEKKKAIYSPLKCTTIRSDVMRYYSFSARGARAHAYTHT